MSIVHEDNEACLKLLFHIISFALKKVVAFNTDNQLADQFTKSLPQDKFLRDRKCLMGW